MVRDRWYSLMGRFPLGVLQQQGGGVWSGLLEAYEYTGDSKVGYYGNTMTGDMLFTDGMVDRGVYAANNRRQDKVQIAYLNNNPDGPYTLYAWIKNTTGASDDFNTAVLGFVDQAAYPATTYPYNQLIRVNSQWSWAGAGVTYPTYDGAWHLVSARDDGAGNTWVGVDDVFAQNTSGNTAWLTATAHVFTGNPNIGTTTGQGYRCYNDIDRFRIFDRALSNDEMLSHFNNGFGLNLFEEPVGAPTVPTDISGLVTWLDASDRGSTTNQWDDKSGKGNHWTAASASEFPTFSGGAASFNGTSNYLTGPNLSSLLSGECFFLHKRYADNSETGVNTGWMKMGTDSLSDHFTYSATIYSGFGSTSRKLCGNPTQDISQYHIVNIWSKTSDWQMNINGSTQLTTTSNTVSFSAAPTLGGQAGLYFQGDIKAFLLFDRKLTATERAAVNTYLGTL